MTRTRQRPSTQQKSKASLPQTLASRILSALATIDRPADFSANGKCPTVFPALYVDGLGDIALPLPTTTAKQLIKLCKQAPYGKGTETVVDTNIRKVWELDPTRFSVQNPKWNSALQTVVREVEAKLGLQNKSLSAHLYKLLVYEKGSFFLPHRDGEKLDRMVATLVVGLPSKYAGGELVVQHQGRQKSIPMPGAASGVETEYAAFYADCQHEVKPLQSGYRLCLAYNLVLAKQRSKTKIVAPNFDDATQQLAAALSKWQPEKHDKHGTVGDETPSKLAIMLEHEYTQGGLSIDKLKGVDLAQAHVLFEAASRAECDAYLALITLWQNGAAEGGDYDYGYGSSRYSRWDDDDSGDSGSPHSMGEIYDESLSANHWSDRKGKRISFGEIPFTTNEIASAADIADTDPDREEFEGYTGNAGMTLERWYHRAAIVVWPQQHQFRIWCDAGTDAALAGLRKMVTQLGKKKSDREGSLNNCRRFAKQILETWRPLRTGYSWDPESIASS